MLIRADAPQAVLDLLKQLARNPAVTSDALRVILAGNIGESAETFTEGDIVRTLQLAEAYGWLRPH